MAGLGSGRLTIGVAAAESRIAVRIEDTGPGIPAERLETVFQPFFSTKLHRGGTGLGLSISQDIVERHGGTLTVRSRPGPGACFEVSLPRYLTPAIAAL
jgi:signal transduction histidine kinase